MKPSKAAKLAHEFVRNTNGNKANNPSERDWSNVLHDEGWWGAAPATCHCGATAIYHVNDKGFCHTHHSEALNVSRQDSNQLLGRYDRAKSNLNFGRSLVSRYLPQQALREACAA